MTDHPAPARATPPRAPSRESHREIFARFVDRLAARLPRRPAHGRA